MRVIYVSGPLRSSQPDGRARNIARAKAAAADIWRRNKDAFVLCPHGNTDNLDGTMDACCIEVDVAFVRERMKPGDMMVMLPGWRTSEGSKLERKAALGAGVVVLSYPTYASVREESDGAD